MTNSPCPSCIELRQRVDELEAEVDRLKAGRGGRPPARDKSERGRLIAAACRRLGITRIELADRLGVHAARLSPTGSFPAKKAEELMAKLRELASGAPQR